MKLQHLPEWNTGRREAAARYRKLFAEAGMGELAPFEPEWAKAVYHLYVIRVEDRDELMRQLAETNIGTGIHYPVLGDVTSTLACALGSASMPATAMAPRALVEVAVVPKHGMG